MPKLKIIRIGPLCGNCGHHWSKHSSQFVGHKYPEGKDVVVDFEHRCIQGCMCTQFKEEDNLDIVRNAHEKNA